MFKIPLSACFAKRDFAIVGGVTTIIGLAVFIFLMINHDKQAIENTQYISKVFSVIVLMIIGLNLTYFIFAFMRNPESIMRLFKAMTADGLAFRFIRDVSALNVLCVFNYTILTLSMFIEVELVQVIFVSLTIGLWPIALLLIFNIDGYAKYIVDEQGHTVKLGGS